MENENWITWTFDYLRLKFQEMNDGRYIQKDNQRIINNAVIGFIAAICMGVIGAVVGFATGWIHFP